MDRRDLLRIFLVAALLTVLNAFKPLHIDDGTFYQNARQISLHPLDPYGFSLLCYSQMTPGNQALSPPVFPYWWGLGMVLFGHHPVLWKLWLFPICFMLVFSLTALTRRFAAGLEWPLTWMVSLSPAVLPSVNLMMDIPALALNLFAIVVFIRAVDERSISLAIISGLVTGLSIQTKYTGFLALGAIVLYSLVAGRRALGALSGAVSLAVFGAWETFMHFRYGSSHFLFHFGKHPTNNLLLIQLFASIFSFVGGLSPVLIPLGLAARYRSRTSVLLASGLILAVFAHIVFSPTRFFEASASLTLGVIRPQYLFFGMGMVVFMLAGNALLRLWEKAQQPQEKIATLFLGSWLLLEVAGVLFISPFPAARRVIELTVVLVLILGRIASRSIGTPDWRPWVHGLAAFSILLGLGYAAVDYWEAYTQKNAAREAARVIRTHEPGANIWYVGYWGFQFYADEEGMRQVVPLPPADGLGAETSAASHPPNASTLREGDWLVVPDSRIPQQLLAQLSPLDQELLELRETTVAQDSLHVRTLWGYYSGNVPLQREPSPRLVVYLLRVKKDFVPQAPKVDQRSSPPL